MIMVIIYITLIIGAAFLLSWPLAAEMTWAMEPGDRVTGLRQRVESFFIKSAGRFAAEEQGWKGYVQSMLLFNGGMFIVGYLILSFQQILPLNPDGRGALEQSLVFHTAASFVSNTNLQHYSGEVSLSYFSQIFGLMWLQFVSAATGIAALTALARALSGKATIGNFFRDLMRSVFLVLLPLAGMVAVLLVLCGVPMTIHGAAVAETLEGIPQIIARGPVAAFVAIKQLGTNGGGFFGANSAHPFENPTFFTNTLESICILLIPMACIWMFGMITGRMRHAAIVFAVMMVLLVAKISFAVCLESAPIAAFTGLPVEAGGNIEGKELRFGQAAAPVWATVTTATSNGSVNGMMDSLNPLTGLIPLTGMWLNCTFGGVGVGLINMFLYIIVGVFICGMMVGRTPEYFNRKVETGEMKLALLALLIHPLFILGGTSLFALTSWGTSTIHNPGAHGFTEILYEFTSAAANNGSGFEGLGDNTAPWNISTGIVMLLSRFIPIVLPLAIAGSLAEKKPAPETSGTLAIDTPLFGMVILGSIIFIGALLFMPVAVLGPITEHLVSGI
jgi:potassium-transporting ATPase potassium-binding subunit